MYIINLNIIILLAVETVYRYNKAKQESFNINRQGLIITIFTYYLNLTAATSLAPVAQDYFLLHIFIFRSSKSIIF